MYLCVCKGWRERQRETEIFTHHIECEGGSKTDGAQKHSMSMVFSVGEECQCRLGAVCWRISECKMGLITDVNRGVYLSFKHQAIMHCL